MKDFKEVEGKYKGKENPGFERRQNNKDFPVKDSREEMIDCKQHIEMPGGRVHFMSVEDKEYPAHPECMKPEKLERPEEDEEVEIKVEDIPSEDGE